MLRLDCQGGGHPPCWKTSGELCGDRKHTLPSGESAQLSAGDHRSVLCSALHVKGPKPLSCPNTGFPPLPQASHCLVWPFSQVGPPDDPGRLQRPSGSPTQLFLSQWVSSAGPGRDREPPESKGQQRPTMSEALCPWSREGGRCCPTPARGGNQRRGWQLVISLRQGHTTATRCHLPPVRMAQTNNVRNNGRWRGRGGTGALRTGGTRAGAAALANRAEFCPRPEGELPCDPATPPLRCPQTHNTDPGRREAPVGPAAETRTHARVRRHVETCHTHDGGRLGRQQEGAPATCRCVRGPRGGHAKRSRSVPERPTPSDLTCIWSLTHKNKHVPRSDQEADPGSRDHAGGPHGRGVRRAAGSPGELQRHREGLSHNAVHATRRYHPARQLQFLET